TRLVDRGDRRQAHRDGGKLPEAGHQPGVWIGAQSAVGRELATEVFNLTLGQPPLEEGTRIDTGRRVALQINEVARAVRGVGAKEVVEADLEQGRERGVGRDMAA